MKNNTKTETEPGLLAFHIRPGPGMSKWVLKTYVFLRILRKNPLNNLKKSDF